jgi:predicted dehydrogenase
MVGVGICGLGFMGMIHFQAYQRLGAAKIVALCDPDKAKLAGDWTSIQGNFGPRGTKMDLSGYQRYSRFEEVLANKEIDLIDICSPTEFHAPMAQQALAAGKHVFVEKPICLTAADADACLAAAQKSKKLLMVGQVLPFFPEFKYALDYVRSGQGGKLLGAHLSRLMCKPTWRKGPQLDGPAVDLHIHDNHFICLLTGTPRAVRSQGMINTEGVVQHVETQYLYVSLDSPFITASSGSLYQPGWPFSHGYTIFLEKATLAFDSLGVPLTLLAQDGKVEKPNLGISGDPVDAFAAELTEVINSVTAATPSALLNGQLGRDALVMSLSEEESVKTGREITL